MFVPLHYLQRGWVIWAASLLASIAGWLIVICWRFHWWWRYAPGPGDDRDMLRAVARKEPGYRWRVDMLDVGHGTAMVIEQNGRHIV